MQAMNSRPRFRQTVFQSGKAKSCGRGNGLLRWWGVNRVRQCVIRAPYVAPPAEASCFLRGQFDHGVIDVNDVQSEFANPFGVDIGQAFVPREIFPR